ncbi:DUF2339 domain-containing protein [Nocardia sp. NPDC051030]|uniref:DUF2339 domain-containing protein n=1 Tax=Nocardia sp. NPDC051030 TaxID=3155162 RepID=UPI003439950B
MNTAIDPRLIARLSNEFTSLSEHMGVLGRDLEVLRCQVVADRSRTDAPEPAPASQPDATTPPATVSPVTGDAMPTAAPPVAPTPAAQPTPPVAQPGGQQAPAAWSPWAPQVGSSAPGPAGSLPAYPRPMPDPRTGAPAAGYGQQGWGGALGQPAYRGGKPRPVREPRAPWWQREGVISRVLAVAGVAVTLIGVVMLLVLAAQAGFFGPVPRVIAGALFSGALVGVAMRVHRKVGGQVGAIALAATGIAGGYLNVVAVTTIYGWLSPAVGYVVAFGIAAGGVALALHWRSQALAVLVVLGAALLSPVVTTELALLAFLIVLQIAATPVQLQRDWPYLHIVRTAPAALTTLVVVAGTALGSSSMSEKYQVLAAAIAVAAVGLVGTVLVVRRRPGDITAALAFAVAAVPLLAAPVMFDRPLSVVIAAVFAAVLLSLAGVPWVPKLAERVRIPGHLAVVLAVTGSFALLEACIGVTRIQTLSIALFLVALCFLAVAGQQRSRVTAGLGTAFAVIGALAFLDIAGPSELAGQWNAEHHLGISTAFAAVAALGTLATALWCVRRLGLADQESEATAVAVVGGLTGLYVVTALTVSLGVATGRPDGFLAGHSIATIIWMAAATATLFFGLRRLSRAPQQAKVALAGGLLLTTAALTKLFLFDLATLDGLIRAAAFLAVGVLLLLVGTRYARAFAEAADRPETTQAQPN